MKKFLVTLLFLLLSISSLLAQVPPPPDYHENAGPGAPSSLPVDQYVFYLLGVAIVAGVYVIYAKRKTANQF